MPRASRTAPWENWRASALSRSSRLLSWRCSCFFPGSIRSGKIMRPSGTGTTASSWSRCLRVHLPRLPVRPTPSGKSRKNHGNDRPHFSGGVIFFKFPGGSAQNPLLPLQSTFLTPGSARIPWASTNERHMASGSTMANLASCGRATPANRRERDTRMTGWKTYTV